jgi:hypothetical protein
MQAQYTTAFRVFTTPESDFSRTSVVLPQVTSELSIDRIQGYVQIYPGRTRVF